MLVIQTLNDLWKNYSTYSSAGVKQKKLDYYLWSHFLRPSFATKDPEVVSNLDILLLRVLHKELLAPEYTQ